MSDYDITAGPGAINRNANTSATYTLIATGNPSTGEGTLTQFKLFAFTALTGVYVGTFYGSGTSYTNRAWASIGNVSPGSVQTFSGLALEVGIGDFIGVYFDTGGLEVTTGGSGANLYIAAGNQCGNGAPVTYTVNVGVISIEAFGYRATITAGPGALERANAANPGYTWICVANPANASGTMTTFRLRVKTAMTGVVVGTFYGSGTYYQSRDHSVIGNISATGLQTFSGLDVDVVVGDYVGIYWSAGNLAFAVGAGTNAYFWTGNAFGAGVKSFATHTGIFGIDAAGDVTVLCLGPGAFDRSSAITNGLTIIPLDNPAVMSGTVNEVELWSASSMTGTVICAMYASGDGYIVRPGSRCVIGVVSSGAKRTFSGLSIPVQAGDFIALYYSGGTVKANVSLDRNYNKAGDQTNVSGLITEWVTGGGIPSIFATGVGSIGWGYIQAIDGVIAISIEAIDGVLADNTAAISQVSV